MKDIKKNTRFKEIENASKKTFEDYKDFAMKGNVVDLAIGVVIGGAFTGIVNSLVTGVITPFLGILTNKVDLSSLYVSLSGGIYTSLEAAKQSGALVLNYGLLLNAILNFFIVSFVLFLIFRYLTKLRKKHDKDLQVAQEVTTKECPYCISQIPIKATRCPHCTSEQKLSKKDVKKDDPEDIDNNN
jgi:large conductance mechanosensitive channel